MIPVRFEPEAQREYLSAGEWYAKRGDQIPFRFADEVAEALRTIAAFPTSFPVVAALRTRPRVRRARLRRFPFFLAYVATDREIRVLAIAHTSRRPLYWRDRLSR